MRSPLREAIDWLSQMESEPFDYSVLAQRAIAHVKVLEVTLERLMGTHEENRDGYGLEPTHAATIQQSMTNCLALIGGQVGPVCEGCNDPATTTDVEGVPLCNKCAAALLRDAEENDPLCELCQSAPGTREDVNGVPICVGCLPDLEVDEEGGTP